MTNSTPKRPFNHQKTGLFIHNTANNVLNRLDSSLSVQLCQHSTLASTSTCISLNNDHIQPISSQTDETKFPLSIFVSQPPIRLLFRTCNCTRTIDQTVQEESESYTGGIEMFLKNHQKKTKKHNKQTNKHTNKQKKQPSVSRHKLESQIFPHLPSIPSSF